VTCAPWASNPVLSG